MPERLALPEYSRHTCDVAVLCSEHKMSRYAGATVTAPRLKEGENRFEARGLLMTWAHQGIHRIPGFKHNAVIE